MTDQMQADFLDAHKRHWDDAELLFSEKCHANADHHYGMAAECGLKQLMVRFGMATNPTTGSPRDPNDWKHANNIWDRFETYRSGHLDGADYGLPTPNPFDNWDVSDRYANRSNFTETGVLDHRAGAEAVRELINKAQLDGLLV